MPERTVYNPNLFVITGGPGSGKTTLLHELARLGIRHAPEVARQIIREQVEAGGTALPWADRETYTNLMLQRSIQSFEDHTPAPAAMLADRGIPDTLGYARLIGLADTHAIESACWCYRYAPIVFLAPPWREIYQTDDERKQDFAEAERTYAVVAAVYGESGYEPLELPQAPPPERARFVAEYLAQARAARGVGLTASRPAHT